MTIYSIKSTKVMACAGSWAYVAEAMVDLPDGETVYVTANDYEELALTVAGKSVYAFLVGAEEDPVEDIREEYGSWKDAKASEYADVFDKLRKTLKMLG